jgi:hypothetical protein
VADTFGDVVVRLPAEQAPGPVDAGIGTDHVTGSPPGVASLDRVIGHPVERVQKFPHRGARAGAQVDHGRPLRQRIEPVQRGYVGRSQIPHMDIVPDARAIAGRVVGPGDQERDAVPLRLDHLAQAMGRTRQLKPGAHLGIGAYRVEIPQGQHADGLHRGDIGEHRLAHRLGPRVRALRIDGRVLIHGQVLAGPVDGGRRTEDQPCTAVTQEVRGELQTLGHVGPVVAHRVGHRIGDHDQGRAMDHGLDVAMLGEDAIDKQPVGDIALVELAARRELAPAGHQAVHDHRGDPRCQTGRRDRAADVTRAPRDQDLHRTP